MKEFIKYLGENLYLDKSILVHKYRDFKKTEKGQKMIETYLDRWKKFGFIEGLEGEISERCAVGMEQLAVYLLTENENNENFDKAFEVIGFPMIRRIFCGSIGDRVKLNNLDLFDFLKFISYCKEINTEKLVDDIYSIINWTKFNAEAEACILACEMIINRFNGDDNRSFDDIKSEYIDKLKEKINKEYEGIGGDNTNA